MHKIDLDEKMFTFHVVGSKKEKRFFSMLCLFATSSNLLKSPVIKRQWAQSRELAPITCDQARGPHWSSPFLHLGF